MQDELGKDVAILGVNAAGHETANATMTAGRDIPLLQDTAAINAWGLWGVEWRDVVVLDRHGAKVGVINLTENDLGKPENQAKLKKLISAAAAVP